MPELPEVETIRRQLEPELEGRRIVGVSIYDERWTRPEPTRDWSRSGWSTERVEGGRKARQVFAAPGSTTVRRSVMHLRMTGNLLLAEAGEESRKFGWRGGLYESPSGAGPPAGRARASTMAGCCSSPSCDGSATPRSSVPESSDPYLGSRIGVEPLDR